MGGGRCTDLICIEHLSEDKPPEVTPAGGTSRSLLRHQPAAPTQNSGSLDSQDMTQETLETYLFSNERYLYWLEPSDLSSFWSAPKDPPVTKASLSELDLERISSDARLRHDVNFDREVSFKPNLQGEAGKKKLALAEEYWVALRIEFTLHLVRRRVMFSHSLEGLGSTDSPWLLGPSVTAKVPLRLPRMFGVIKEILKTLVPQADWSTVDARLDVELLIQELENGVCDLVALSKWLGDLLQGSCSPMRDTTVQSAVSMIQRGVKQDNAWRMVLGLRDFFGILETMKLVSYNFASTYIIYESG